MFYLAAYRITKKHAVERLKAKKTEWKCDVFAAFENAFIRRQLIDREKLRAELNSLHGEFGEFYGSRFQL